MKILSFKLEHVPKIAVTSASQAGVLLSLELCLRSVQKAEKLSVSTGRGICWFWTGSEWENLPTGDVTLFHKTAR